MPLTLEDVITPTTAAEIEAEVLSLCATGGLPTSSWQSGSVVRTIIKEISEVIARKSLVEIEIARGMLGDLTSGEWAKLWAQQIYDVLFIPAAAATGYVKATNTEAEEHVLLPGQLTLAHRVTGATYRNQEEITIPSSGVNGGILDNIAIQADAVGTGSDAAPGYVTKIVSPALVGVEFVNLEPVLGADEETTVALVLRTRLKLGSLSPLGPKDAYDYVARTPLDTFDEVNGSLLEPTSTPITRSRTTSDPLTGQVICYLATANGVPDGADVARVQLGFDRWAEPHCVDSLAVAAEALTVNVTYQAWIKSSIEVAQIEVLIGAALARFFSTIDVGGVVIPPATGKVYQEAIDFVIHTAVPGTVRVSVTLPAGDLDVAPNQVPVLGTITPTITILR